MLVAGIQSWSAHCRLIFWAKRIARKLCLYRLLLQDDPHLVPLWARRFMPGSQMITLILFCCSWYRNAHKVRTEDEFREDRLSDNEGRLQSTMRPVGHSDIVWHYARLKWMQLKMLLFKSQRSSFSLRGSFSSFSSRLGSKYICMISGKCFSKYSMVVNVYQLDA